jgi:RNA polymerase sigma-70 factor, ECF subfamily
MNRMETNDAAAVAQALAGDRDAFRQLVERHSHAIFRLAFRMTGNEQDAEEVVQDTFLRAYRSLEQFESRANFGTWLYRIGVNCSLDFVRSRKRHVEGREVAAPDEDAADPLDSIASAAPGPDRLAMAGQLRKKVETELSRLSETERTAFMLRHVEGRSIEEIGAILGLRTSATKNSIFRAVQKLRTALEPLAGHRSRGAEAGT